MDYLTSEWRTGVLFCELRDTESRSIEDSVIFGVFRVDGFADVRQKIGDDSLRLCDIMNVVNFKALEEGSTFSCQDAFQILAMASVSEAVSFRRGAEPDAYYELGES